MRRSVELCKKLYIRFELNFFWNLPHLWAFGFMVDWDLGLDMRVKVGPLYLGILTLWLKS